MDAEPVAIPSDATVERALDEYFLRYRWPWFPVVDAAAALRRAGQARRRRRGSRGEPDEPHRLRAARRRGRRAVLARGRARPLRRADRVPAREPRAAPPRRARGGRRGRPPDGRRHASSRSGGRCARRSVHRRSPTSPAGRERLSIESASDDKTFSWGDRLSSEAPSLGGAAGSAEQPRLRWLRRSGARRSARRSSSRHRRDPRRLRDPARARQPEGAPGPRRRRRAPAIDEYAEFLRDAGGPVDPRAGAALGLPRRSCSPPSSSTSSASRQLIRRNRAARPDGNPPVVQRSLASRTMAVSGFLLLAFIVFHVLQFTTLTIDPTPLGQGEVYANLYNAFQEWWLVVLYVGDDGRALPPPAPRALERPADARLGQAEPQRRPSGAARRSPPCSSPPASRSIPILFFVGRACRSRRRAVSAEPRPRQRASPTARSATSGTTGSTPTSWSARATATSTR